MTIKLTETDLRKMNRSNKASMIIKENCNKVIRENKTISYNQLFNTICETSNALHRKGVKSNQINEGIMDALGSIFGNSPGGFMQSFKERIISFILPKIGIDGELLSFLKVALGNLEFSDLKLFLSPLDNCEKIADVLTDSIIEYLGEYLLRKMDVGGGWISDTFRNAAFEALNNDGFVQDLQDKFAPMFCEKIRSAFGSNAEEVVGQDIVDNVE